MVAADLGKNSREAVLIRTIGGFSLQVGDTVHHLARRKSQALLTYLCLKPDHSETRDRLAGLFWSNSSPSASRTSLRQEMSRLNRELAEGAPALNGDKYAIWLARRPVQTDIEQLSAAMAGGEVTRYLLPR